MVKVNNIFSGKIDGNTPYQKYGEIGRLDRKNGKLSDRLDNVNQILEEDDFFLDYFDNYYKPEISQDSALSEENNIAQILSSMADYLINSDESREIEKENKTEYVFTEDYFNKKTKRHEEINGNSIDKDDNIQYVESRPNTLKFKNNKTVINKKDYNLNNEMSRILNEYNTLLKRVDELNNMDISKTRKYNSIKSSIFDDMKMVKESYLGVFPRSKKVPHGHYVKPVPENDYSNIKTVRALINSNNIELEKNYELWENYFDFKETLEGARENDYISSQDMAIIQLRSIGYAYRDIINMLGLKNSEKEIRTNRLVSIQRKIYRYTQEMENEKWINQQNMK